MKTQRWCLVFLFVGASMVGLSHVGAGTQAQSLTGSEPQQHCAAHLAPVQPGATGSTVLAEQCFDTFDEAWTVAGGDALENGVDGYVPGGLTTAPGFQGGSADVLSQAAVVHCAVQLAPIRSGEDASRIVAQQCFDTFAEALSQATSGAVQLERDARPADFSDDMLAGASSTAATLPFGINYQNSNYGGSSYTWYGNSTQPCSSSLNYGINFMPSGWDNKVSSARTIAEMRCRNNYHYQYTYYGGTILNCFSACTGMGSMNDRTSSERWTA